MKKSIFVVILLTGQLLAGCGEDVSSQELATMKQQFTDLETKYEKLYTDYANLQEQYDQVILDQEVLQEQQEKQNRAQILEEQFVSISPQKLEGPYQTLAYEDGYYEVKHMMLTKQPNEEDNVFEIAFQQLFPQLTFNEIIIHDNQTITIDFNENSTGSPHLTTTTQVSMFFDELKFFLYYNFPDLKAYYIYSNGEPTSIGETSVFTEAQPNNGVDFENIDWS